MDNVLNFAVDLLWVRHKKVGGIESYVRNLLNGFKASSEKFHCFLLVSKDNRQTFESYLSDDRFELKTCNVLSAKVGKRIIWQNLHLGKTVRSLGLNLCFEPYYCKPFWGTRKVKFVTTIHDLQALHYPQYFSGFKVRWMKLSWKKAVKSSKKIVAISNYVKTDILNNFKVKEDKIEVIYNPILIDKKNVADFKILEENYGVVEREYYFTVSSLLPHKNIKTIINTITEIKRRNITLPHKLIVSGVGGKDRDSLTQIIKNNGLDGDVILTGFIDDDERNALYKHCRAFIFPSMFEGFGMPPVEAMMLGAPVITTGLTSIPEVTFDKAYYVDNALNTEDWIKGLLKIYAQDRIEYYFDEFNVVDVAKKYITLLRNS